MFSVCFCLSDKYFIEMLAELGPSAHPKKVWGPKQFQTLYFCVWLVQFERAGEE